MPLLATKEESEQFLKEARDFVSANGMFNSYMGVAVLAVAEYIASKNNKTLYEHLSSSSAN